MTEEQNKLAEEIEKLGGSPRQAAEGRLSHLDRMQLYDLVTRFGSLICSFSEREPATEAVRDQVLEEAAKACEITYAECRHYHAITPAVLLEAAAAVRALKGKGASQGAFGMVMRQPAFALMEYLLTQGQKFDIPDSIWIPFVDELSDEQKG